MQVERSIGENYLVMPLEMGIDWFLWVGRFFFNQQSIDSLHAKQLPKVIT